MLLLVGYVGTVTAQAHTEEGKIREKILAQEFLNSLDPDLGSTSFTSDELAKNWKFIDGYELDSSKKFQLIPGDIFSFKSLDITPMSASSALRQKFWNVNAILKNEATQLLRAKTVEVDSVDENQWEEVNILLPANLVPASDCSCGISLPEDLTCRIGQSLSKNVFLYCFSTLSKVLVFMLVEG